MSRRLNWDKRRPAFVPWYARLDRDPFGRDASNRVRHPPKQIKPAKPKLPAILSDASDISAPIRTPLERPTVPASALARKYALRTGDLAKAREALSGASEAVIWCDGSAVPNPGIVGAGAVIVAGAVRLELHSGGWRGTNNSGELAAAIMAIEALPDGCRATVIADSEYLIKGMKWWRHNWRTRDFKRNGVDMANASSWRKLDALTAGRSISWQWIRGHNGDPMNELADKLAALGRTGGRA